VLGDVAGARALREKVLEVRSRTLPDDHPDLQSARKDLASTIRELGDLEGARALEEKVLEVRSRTLPDDHPDLQSTRSDLAKTLFLLGDLAGARALLEEVFEVRSRTLPDDHLMLQALRCSLPVTIVCQLARAERSLGAEGDRTSENQGRERCVELIGAMCRAQVRAARAAILESPGREAEERCASLAKLLDWPLSFAQGFGVFDALPELEAPSFELSETTRVATITSAELARKAAKAPEYEDLREELRKASDALVGLAQKGTTSEEFDRARTRREAAERKLVALANELSGGKQPGLQLDVESLAAALDADEAAVGLRRFKRLRIGVVETLDSTGQPAVRDNSVNGICAFVVRSSKEGARRSSSPPSALTLVDLGPIATIEEAVHAWRDGLGVGNGSRGVAAATPERSARDVDAQGASLREKIFDPLLPALAGARHIVVALDDVLHLVPLDALPSGDGSLVGDRWQIETRTTLTELLRSTEPLEDAGLLVALGDIEYRAEELPEEGGEAIQLAEPAVAPRAAEDAGILRGSAWSGGFSPLPGTGVEVRGIERCFREQFGASAAAELYEQAGATRERLLEVAPKARWLHIATHGWFAPESIRSWSDPEPLDKRSDLGVRLGGEQQVRGMSPMLLCGLALAGANLPEDAVGRVPGLVTADELSTLDLWSCELVVLSACDTNVGERRAGQGVASLQKALQMAGARSVITSLWKVPDEATKELMLDFYRRLWVEKKPKWEALACGARSGRGCEGGGP
jgi:CHAT domain-containing protein